MCSICRKLKLFTVDDVFCILKNAHQNLTIDATVLGFAFFGSNSYLWDQQEGLARMYMVVAYIMEKSCKLQALAVEVPTTESVYLTRP